MDLVVVTSYGLGCSFKLRMDLVAIVYRVLTHRLSLQAVELRTWLTSGFVKFRFVSRNGLNAELRIWSLSGGELRT